MNKYEYKKALECLNLKNNAKISDIKNAYRKLVKIYHPDKVQGKKAKLEAQEKFKEINKAYHYLLDNYTEDFDFSESTAKNGYGNKTYQSKNTDNNYNEEFEYEDNKTDMRFAKYFYDEIFNSTFEEIYGYPQRKMPFSVEIMVYIIFNLFTIIMYCSLTS